MKPQRFFVFRGSDFCSSMKRVDAIDFCWRDFFYLLLWYLGIRKQCVWIELHSLQFLKIKAASFGTLCLNLSVFLTRILLTLTSSIRIFWYLKDVAADVDPHFFATSFNSTQERRNKIVVILKKYGALYELFFVAYLLAATYYICNLPTSFYFLVHEVLFLKISLYIFLNWTA